MLPVQEIEIQNVDPNNAKQTDQVIEQAQTQMPQSGSYNPDQIISIKNVHKTYLLGIEGVTALRGVSFDVKEGEFVMIQGTSGGGKTTLLNIMGTIDKPTKGDVFICGQKIKSNTKDKFLASLRLSKIGFVFQTFNLISSLTALENVELPMILRGALSRSAIRKRAIDLLQRVGLQDRINHFPNQLSGGEQQRVTITRALGNSPKILMLDEPTGDLDTKNTELVMKILLDLNMKDKITMIMVTHDVSLKCFANRIVKIMDGKISGIEQIGDKQRQENIQILNDIVQGNSVSWQQQNILGVKSGTVTSNIENQLINTEYVHQDINNLDQAKQSSNKSEVRKPTDYAVKNFALKQNKMKLFP